MTHPITRREWLAAATAAATAATLGAAMPKPLGAQLYTVRNILMKEPDRVFKTLADIGYTEVEGNRADLVQLISKVREYGLKPTSCHIETPLVIGKWESYPDLKPMTLDEAIDSAKKVGVEYFTMAYISPGARGDNDDFYRRTADQMNMAGQKCKKAGLQFAYHNHAYEFGGEPGKRPIDIFSERLDGNLVKFELDVFWLSIAGQDPLEALKKWKGRVALLHLKDKAKDAPHQFSENVPPGTFKEVGSGVIDFPAILKAAPAAGVKQYIVEQDQTPGDPLVSLRKSFDYLKTV
ncbi:MAG TPA: sugar phosphate isomerase/epimerase [Bryobacteraceae bacterium]|nr:sugar phosphate isomerase/epimerase [Bryobacteraceae bacterium]